MAWDHKAVTTAGKEIITKLLSGAGALTLTRAVIGTGTSDPYGLAVLENLPQVQKEIAYSSEALIDETTRCCKITLQITSQGNTTGFQMRQIGFCGKLTGTSDALIAVLQDTQGVYIPSEAEDPAFVFDFQVILPVDGDSKVTVLVDAGAYVTQGQLLNVMETIPQSVKEFSFTIHLTDWEESAATGSTDESAFHWMADVADVDIDTQCIPYVTLNGMLPAGTGGNTSLQIALACGLCSVVEIPSNGKLRFFAQTHPEAEIRGVCRLLKQRRESGRYLAVSDAVTERLTSLEVAVAGLQNGSGSGHAAGPLTWGDLKASYTWGQLRGSSATGT